jgi:2-polyprenyl-3-methyl-5-hydroxy-6-metoxy-1,4-benzoquinol methylase
MATDQLTDREFWLRYWESKQNLIFRVTDQYLFIRQLRQLIQQRQAQGQPIRTSLEVGGFPGYYSVWLRREAGVKATLLDFVVHTEIMDKLLVENGLQPGEVTYLEKDLFTYTPQPGYDLVLSNGLIEHFQDTAGILKRHVDMLAEGGQLFITLPNFRGLNGWFQRRFDPANFDKHNLAAMDPDRLKTISESIGLTEVESNYFGHFSIWLENKAQQPTLVRWFLSTVWLVGKVISKVIPVESRGFSPYIVLTGRRPTHS